jgi:predicted membrane channel-forming protein YqfA (hemolysin III family)
MKYLVWGQTFIGLIIAIFLVKDIMSGNAGTFSFWFNTLVLVVYIVGMIAFLYSIARKNLSHKNSHEG